MSDARLTYTFVYGPNMVGMEAITIRLEETTLESIEEEASEYDRTRSEHIREVIQSRHDHDRIRDEYEEHLTEYEEQIEELERENDRLKDEYQERIEERREEHEREIERLKREQEERVDRLEREHEQQVDRLKDEHEERLADLRAEYEEEIADLQEQNERLQTSRDDLQRQLAATNRRVDQHQELVDYVEEQRSLERYRARREQMIDQAGMLTRWKWRLTGVPVDEQDENEE